ncbi:FUSC family protein [Smaragdicoccus niigatensis]|uniref:FUSC family protein n=1 Tax=Smaragdicoccus niigatensis TaxID=359359 RepID=UPI00037272C5|nr:FUSC family protein [Smaragdicoccus niigatensis]
MDPNQSVSESPRATNVRASIPHQLKSSARGALADVTRWKQTEINVLRWVAAGLSLTLPLLAGHLSDHLSIGMAGALGALAVSGAGHAGVLRNRLADLALAGVVTTVSLYGGIVAISWGQVGSVLVIGFAFAVAIVGGIRRSFAIRSTQAVVFVLVGGSLQGASAPTWHTVAGFAGGAVMASILTVCAFTFERALLGGQVGGDPAPHTLRADVRTWRHQMTTLIGWQYPLRFVTCLIVGETIAHLKPGTHSYWILLTITLVVQRDHNASRIVTIQRGVGTLLGVVVGALFLLPLPFWLVSVLLGVLGAIRTYLKTANYAAYSLVMTPLVVIFTELDMPLTAEFLRERIVDTAIGCVVALTVGSAVWQRLGSSDSQGNSRR